MEMPMENVPSGVIKHGWKILYQWFFKGDNVLKVWIMSEEISGHVRRADSKWQ